MNLHVTYLYYTEGPNARCIYMYIVYAYLYYTEGPNGEVGQGNRFYHCYFNTSIRDRGIQLAGPVDFTFHLGVRGGAIIRMKYTYTYIYLLTIIGCMSCNKTCKGQFINFMYMYTCMYM